MLEVCFISLSMSHIPILLPSLGMQLQVGSSCPNVFEGCTPDINCPYFANPMTGKCESSSTIAAGVYTIFNSVEECCYANYPDPSSCIPVAAPPTASPSVQTVLTPIIDSPSPLDTEGIFYLDPMSITFFNLPPQYEMNDDQRGMLEDIIQNVFLPTSSDFDTKVLSVDVIDSIFSGPDQESSQSFNLEITITGNQDIIPIELHTAFINTLHDQLYNIANMLRTSWGPEIYSNGTILSIADVQTTLVPTHRPSLLDNDLDLSLQNNAEQNASTPAWAIVLIVLLLALFGGGIFLWYRWRMEKDVDERLPSHNHNNSYFDGDISDMSPSKMIHYLNPGVQTTIQTKSDQSHVDDMSFQSYRSQLSRGYSESPRSNGRSNINFNESNQHQKSKNKSVDPSRQISCVQQEMVQYRPKVDPEGTKSFNESMSFTQSAMNINRGHDRQQESKNANMTRSVNQDIAQPANLNTFDESGYDGGKSSLFIVNESGDAKDDVSDDSSEDKFETNADGSSSDEGNVLGLLYYDGASSANESEARESRLSRRSRRTNRSGKSKSTKSRSSRQTRSSRSQQQRSIARKKMPKKAQNFVTKPIREEDVSASGPIVVGGAQSVVSGLHDDLEDEQDFARTLSGQDTYASTAFNSVGECTKDLCNKPEVKF